MSMISKQVQTLREYADERKGEISSLCREAADTIEVLSAKVSGVNLQNLTDVVRCKDCKHYHDGDCDEMPKLVGDDDYCSYGERIKP